MRLGWDDNSRNAPEIAALAESLGVKAITVHGRTRQQFYGGSAVWRAVADVSNRKRPTRLPVIVNGDITGAGIGCARLWTQSGADAVMIRDVAPMARPWIAAALDRALESNTEMLEPDVASRLGIAAYALQGHTVLLWRRVGAQGLPQAFWAGMSNRRCSPLMPRSAVRHVPVCVKLTTQMA